MQPYRGQSYYNTSSSGQYYGSGNRPAGDNRPYRSAGYGHARPSASTQSRSFVSTDAKQIPLKIQYLRLIQNGSKTVEGRIHSGQFKWLKVGETVEFMPGPVSVRCVITTKNVYRSFREMLEREGVSKCLPDVRSIDEGVRIYESIPSYRERAQREGVVAFGVRLETAQATSAVSNSAISSTEAASSSKKRSYGSDDDTPSGKRVTDTVSDARDREVQPLSSQSGSSSASAAASSSSSAPTQSDRR